MKVDNFHGSVVNGIREPILFSFVLDKPSGYKIFCQTETIHNKNLNISFFNAIPFYLEDDTNEDVNFNGEAIIFTLQMIKF